MLIVYLELFTLKKRRRTMKMSISSKQNKGRLLGFLICFVMLLGFLPITVSAEGTIPITSLSLKHSGYARGKTISDATVTTNTPGVTITSYRWVRPDGPYVTETVFDPNVIQYGLSINLSIDSGYSAEALTKENISVNGAAPYIYEIEEDGDIRIVHWMSKAPESDFIFWKSEGYDIPVGEGGTAITAIDVSETVSGGTLPYTYSLDSGAPSWLSIDSSTGRITGTRPSVATPSARATVTVTDSASQSDSIEIKVGKVNVGAEQEYGIIVTNGKAFSGGREVSRAAGDMTVELVVDEVPDGAMFLGWWVISGEADLDDMSSPVTSFVMPERDVEVAAVVIPLVTRIRVACREPYAGAAPGAVTYTLTPALALNGTMVWYESEDGTTFKKMTSDKFEAGKYYAVTVIDIMDIEGGEDFTPLDIPGTISPVTNVSYNGRPGNCDWFTDMGMNDYKFAYKWGPLPDHTHSHESKWMSDAEGHWHECVCGDRADSAPHTPGAAATRTTPQTCTVCGYEIAPALGLPWPFTDVQVQPGIWKYESVKYVHEHSIMGGVGGSSSFQPDHPLTRAMFATVLYRMAGEPATAYSSKFSDVAPGKWYSSAILWASGKGIVSGYSDSSYGINDNINREQIAKMLYLYGKSCGYDMSGVSSLENFTDKDRVSSWAQDYMKWAVKTKMISGKPNGDSTFRLDPKGEATRAECAKMLMMFSEKHP